MIWSDELVFKGFGGTVFGFGMGWVGEDDGGFVWFRSYGSSHVLYPPRFQRAF